MNKTTKTIGSKQIQSCAENVLCGRCLRDQQTHIKYALQRESKEEKTPFDKLCKQCEQSLHLHWLKHYWWFINEIRSPGKQISKLPHEEVSITISSILFHLHWFLSSIGPILYLFSGKFLILIAIVECTRNPLWPVFTKHKNEKERIRKFYFDLLNICLGRYRYLQILMFLIRLLVIFKPSFKVFFFFLFSLLVQYKLSSRILRSYVPEYAKGPPVCHLSSEEMQQRLRLDPNDFEDEKQSVFSVPQRRPDLCPKPQGFGTGNLFQGRMDQDLRILNQAPKPMYTKTSFDSFLNTTTEPIKTVGLKSTPAPEYIEPLFTDYDYYPDDYTKSAMNPAKGFPKLMEQTGLEDDLLNIRI